MTDLFPFTLPGSTSLYLLLCVVTLVIHFIFMSYVLAGSVWVMFGLFAPRGAMSEITAVLKDWMPVMLSGAITAGVAPLLFIQILYRQQFYTANLLQFHRWMAILPILIVLFYLAYLIKAHGDRQTWIQRIAAVACVGCVLFIAWSWSGNHLLSLQEPATWVAHYANEVAPGPGVAVSLRLSLWIALTFPVLSCLLTWQLRNRRAVDADHPPGVARTSAIAICGTVAAVVLAVFLVSRMPDNIRADLIAGPVRVWVTAAALGTIVHFAGWVARFRSRGDTLATRAAVTLGIVLQLMGVMMCREQVRVSNLGERIDFISHAEAAESGGFGLFLMFCAVNGFLAVWCIRLVRRANG